MNASNKQRMTLLAAATASLMLMACGRPADTGPAVAQKTEAAKPAAAVVNTAEQARTALADAAITAKIQLELADDPGLKALKIKVATKDGLVDLTGTAPDLISKDRATRAAATVKGVLSVDNHMVVAG